MLLENNNFEKSIFRLFSKKKRNRNNINERWSDEQCAWVQGAVIEDNGGKYISFKF